MHQQRAPLAQGIRGGQAAGPARISIERSTLEASANVLGVDIASWKTETPKGNFASLRVPNEGKDEPLSIESLSVSVTIEGRMARTEVKQVFRNHLSQQTEGTYEFTLPANAAISRLAMDVEGKMMEGELVERERARLIYEGIVNRKKDPALLEWQGGERFQTQIFPIPASGTKTVVLTYEVMLPESRQGLTYRYNLPNLEGADSSEIAAFDFRLDAVTDRPLELRGYEAQTVKNPKSTHISFDRKGFLPTGPIEVAFGLENANTDEIIVGARDVDGEQQQFFVIDHMPELPGLTAGSKRNYVVAIDTSAGLGDPVVDQSKVTALLAMDMLEEGAQFNVVHGDYQAHTCSTQPLTKGDRAVVVDCLKGLDSGGASDLGALLDHATRAAAEMNGPTSIILFTDGVASLGELDGELILAQTTAALTSKEIALHTVAVGHSPAEAELKTLARATQGHSIRMTPGELPHHVAMRLGDRIREPLMTGLRAQVVEGTVSYLTPSTGSNVARGEAVTILGRLDSPTATVKLTGDYQGRVIEKTIKLVASKTPADNTMLPNFWARAAIDAMEAEGLHRREISAHSLRYGVMSKYTSFLVLENDEAYKRFDIERRKETQRQVAQTEKKEAKNLTKGDEDLKDVLSAAPTTTTAQANSDGDGLSDDMAMPESEEVMSELAKEMAPQEAPRRPRSEPKKKMKRRDMKPSPSPIDLDSDDRVGDMGRGGGGATGEGKGVGFRAQPDPNVRPTTPRSLTPAERIQLLGPRRDHLSAKDAGILLSLYLQNNQADEARVYLDATRERLSANVDAADAIFNGLLNDPNVRATFAKETGEAALALITYQSQEGEAIGHSVAVFALSNLIKAQRWNDIVSLFGQAEFEESTLRAVLSALVDANQREVAGKLLVSLEKKMSPQTLYSALEHSPWREQFSEELFSYSAKIIKADLQNNTLFERHLRLGETLGRGKEMIGLVQNRCEQSAVALSTCRAWLRTLNAPLAAEAEKELIKQRLVNMKKIRAHDISNPTLIQEFVTLFRENGEDAKADRLMSELVEFTPHDFSRRMEYGNAFQRLNRPVEACQTFASAVQLNPAQRDTFRAMMNLRRSFEAESNGLRECVVQGVSNLPVTRDVSLILTWEDPTADVDLHIREATGESINYTHRESRQGGLLYYDITDGYGPEIYVLGNGQKGKYDLEVVYFSGSTANIKGTLTILRNAGAADEVREHIDFMLPKSDSSKKIPLGDITL